jgi:hypothetical protein
MNSEKREAGGFQNAQILDKKRVGSAGCFVCFSYGTQLVPVVVQDVKDILNASRHLFVVTDEEKYSNINSMILSRVDGNEKICCCTTFLGLKKIPSADVSASSPALELDLTNIGDSGETAVSEPFEVCGLNFAIKVIYAKERSNSNPKHGPSAVPTTAKGYKPTLSDYKDGTKECFFTITRMPDYSGFSLEELRAADYIADRIRPGQLAKEATRTDATCQIDEVRYVHREFCV